MTQNHCFSKKYQPAVLKTTLKVCLKDISTFTEHTGVLEYRHHGDLRESSRTLSILLFKLASLALFTLKLLFVCVINNYQLYRVQ